MCWHRASWVHFEGDALPARTFACFSSALAPPQSLQHIFPFLEHDTALSIAEAQMFLMLLAEDFLSVSDLRMISWGWRLDLSHIQEKWGGVEARPLACVVLALLEELGVAYVEEMSMEPKLAAQRFMQNNVGAQHNFETIAAVNEMMREPDAKEPKKLYCSHHACDCPLPPRSPDCWICGFPCAPYSLQRSQKKEVAWRP